MHSRETIPDSPLDAPPLAVILAAGEGSRLTRDRDGVPKPVLSLLGLSLAERTISSCIAAGIQRFLVVLGYCAGRVRANYPGIAVRCVWAWVGINRSRRWSSRNISSMGPYSWISSASISASVVSSFGKRISSSSAAMRTLRLW